MNKIVLENYPAAKLPDELRRGIPPKASVKVIVEEVSKPALSAEQMRRQWLEVRKSLKHKVTVEEAVARVRELRDEWDD